MLGTNPDKSTSIMKGSLQLNDECGVLTSFSWAYECCGLNFVDSIDLDNKERKCEIKSIHCLHTVVIGIGDIPYQAFMLGKLNMGGSHYSYCNCSSSLFGKEDTTNIITFTQQHLIDTGKQKKEHT